MDMVELPRSEVDFKIDELSDHAKLTIAGMRYGANEPTEFFDLGTAAELEAQGFIVPHGADESLPQLFEATWQGQLASERLRCGIYDKHKELYAARTARDAMLEAIPGFASF